MNPKTRFTLIVLISLFILLVTSASTLADTPKDKVVFGGSYELASGTTLSGNLIILGGTVTLKQASNVTGDTVLVGGTLDADGTITGSLILIGGTSHLGDNAVVRTDLVSIGGSLTRAPASSVLGEVVDLSRAPLSLRFPGAPDAQVIPVVPVVNGTGFLWDVLYLLGMAVFTSALSMLVVLLWARPTQRVANAMRANMIGSGGFGCLTLIVLPALLLLLAITIILAPLSALGLLALAVAILYGWVAINLEVGNRLAKLFRVEWSAPIAAGIGGLLFNLVVFGLGWIPCVGWALVFLVILLALGGVLITRFGTIDYPHPLPPTPAVPAVAAIQPGRPVAVEPAYPEVVKPAAPAKAAKAAKPKTAPKQAAKPATAKTAKPAPVTSTKPAAGAKSKPAAPKKTTGKTK